MSSTVFALNPNPKTKAESYWNGVHDEANRVLAEHPGMEVFHITSIEDRINGIVGGRVFEATIRTAAERIVNRTHRLSTAEEIAEYRANDQKEVARLADIVERQKNQSILKPSQEQMTAQADMIGHVVKAVLQELKGDLKPGRQKENN